MASLVGALVGEKYLIREHIGGGAMGDVYLAEHTALERPFAIKVLKIGFAEDPVLLERFRREAHATSRLEHVNIVYIADFGRLDSGQPYLVMEYIKGRTLRQELDATAPGVLPLPRVQLMLEQILGAAEVAHGASVVHRDLKPDNILIGASEDGADRIKILDFGVAKILGDSGQAQLTRAGEMFGTPTYMAPEQATGQGIDHRSDLYSVGVIAYEMVAGRPPFTHASIPGLIMAHLQEAPPAPSTVRPATAPAIPELLESLILACLAKQPGDRPACAADVLSVLRQTRPLLLPASPISIEVSRNDADSQEGETGDWGTVSVEASFNEVSAISVPGENLDPHPKTTLAPEAGEPSWERAIDRAMHAAAQLKAIFRAPKELLQLMEQLGHLAQEAQAAAGKLVAAINRRTEIEQAVRKLDAQLRHAIIDRREERLRAAEAWPKDRELVADLDFQIGAMEKRLGELYREQRRKQGALGALIEERQSLLEQAQKALVDEQVALLNILHHSRPDPCPGPIQETYDEVARLLRAL